MNSSHWCAMHIYCQFKSIRFLKKLVCVKEETQNLTIFKGNKRLYFLKKKKKSLFFCLKLSSSFFRGQMGTFRFFLKLFSEIVTQVESLLTRMHIWQNKHQRACLCLREKPGTLARPKAVWG